MHDFFEQQDQRLFYFNEQFYQQATGFLALGCFSQVLQTLKAILFHLSLFQPSLKLD